MRQLSIRKLLGVANRFRCGADGAGRYNPMGRQALRRESANTRHKSKFGACGVRQLVGEDCYAGALAVESSTARHLVLGLVQAGAGVRTMKYIIAIVTVVVGMTGLCRADDAATQRQAVLYEEDQAPPNGTRFAGSAEWRTEWPAPGTALQRNVQLLKEPGWLDIPIVYGEGKRAILAVQKAPLTAETLSLLERRHDSQHSVAVLPKLPNQIVSPALALPTKAPEYASQPAASAERRVALVIGNSEYSSTAFLPNPRRDAKAVADALREVGFQTVDLAFDLDRDAMVKALRAFRDQADKADWALIYFAGHGIEMSGVNYLVPIDAKLFDDRDVKTETVSYEELLDAARGAKMLRLLVLDACRVNPFKDSMRRTMASRGSNDRGLAPPPEAEPGTLVVYSAKDGEVAADDIDGVNSPFARAFVAELKVPGLEVRRLFDYVRDDVLDATNKHQQPFTYGSLPGRWDFYFVAKR
jgi:hypothetical protein